MNQLQSIPSTEAAAEDWWRGAVIYQIYPRSFADSNGDGVGDLPGIAARLDHVASLGVDAIWLSPFFASPMRDFGYDISDYRAVDPIFGTLEDFDRLLARAHQLGLKVVIDQVYSHTSDAHAWFRESRASRDNPKADWYVWADAKPDGSPPNNWQSVFYGPTWTWDARRGQYYLHNFLSSQPDLNLHNPEVQAAILDVTRFWLDRGVDGFRLDAINFAMHDPALTDNPPVVPGTGKRRKPFDFQHHLHNQSHADIPAFLARVRALTDSYGGRFMVAEVGGEQANREMKLFTQEPDRLHSAYGFNYLYADSLTPALIRETMTLWPGEAGEGWPSWAFSNHDAPRHISRWAAGRDPEAVARLTMLLLVALRGNIFLYQGEELGLPQAEVPFDRLQDPEAIANWPETHGRDGARTPMPWRAGEAHAGFSIVEPWLPIDAAHVARAVDRQEADPGSMLHFARRIIALRKQEPALRTGIAHMLDVPAPLVAFDRGAGDDRLLCVFNLGDESADYPLPARWRTIESTGAGERLTPLGGFIAKAS
ncbi:alpha-amylase family glycosyl hydrolase [Sphingosinicella sp. LHD-64]|uniref:alpha-amylase family glycosyl hydrolase n=1 Tax=Sphingosinicella sp. LHD-64 TaxID=3072139 RepID=UPI00280F8DD7|nr:alpha-amylase family glycosyl hydrolase [Sphingosinicella sp. LHD-64]MDQ8756788.1 alpha-amylase family glycosyl hydrolase [Sphingosinicella sp. LHD-64]